MLVTHLHGNRFKPLILGYQRVIGGHCVVNGDRHDGLLQVSCNSVRTIYSWLRCFIDYVDYTTTTHTVLVRMHTKTHTCTCIHNIRTNTSLCFVGDHVNATSTNVRNIYESSQHTCIFYLHVLYTALWPYSSTRCLSV